MAMRAAHKRYPERFVPAPAGCCAPAAAAVPTSCGFLGLGLPLSAGALQAVPGVPVAPMPLSCFSWLFGTARPVPVPRLRGR